MLKYGTKRNIKLEILGFVKKDIPEKSKFGTLSITKNNE